jgi:glycosyltransferase involved in cell wall biosynthesis
MIQEEPAADQPWITVATVVRDDPDGLRATMDSVLSQQHVSDIGVEWLIIDSSADRDAAQSFISLAKSSSLAVRSIWTEPAGIYPAMNVALHEARGQFILFLNAGDLLANPGLLSELHRLWQDSALDVVDWIVGRVRIISRNGLSIDSASWSYSQEKSALFARGVFPPHQGTIVRTEVLRSIGGFDTRYAIAGDYHCALRLSQMDEPLMTDLVIAEFREGGVSTTRWRKAAREFHKARTEVFAPRGRTWFVERWYSMRTFVTMFIYRDLLRRDR